MPKLKARTIRPTPAEDAAITAAAMKGAMTAKPNDNDVNSREYWERAVSNPKEHDLTDRQAQAMRESLTLTDPEHWEKVLAAPETHGLNAEQAKQLAEWAMKPRHERNQLTPAEEIEAEASFHEALYGAEHVRTWLEMGAVSPMNAALQLNSKNPTKYKGTAPDFGDAFDLMLLAFEDTARDGLARNLREWIVVARARNLHGVGLDGWDACITQRKAASAVDGGADYSTDFTMLATRQQLVDAFGSFSDMNASWFTNLKDAPRLEAARKVTGQGGRGHIAEPLFCPYEVMLWMADPKRRKGRKLSENKAWGLLEKHFPKVYNAHSIGDPRAQD